MKQKKIEEIIGFIIIAIIILISVPKIIKVQLFFIILSFVIAYIIMKMIIYIIQTIIIIFKTYSYYKRKLYDEETLQDMIHDELLQRGIFFEDD